MKGSCRLVIESISEDGRKFRPSDWIERISTQAATFGSDHKINYSLAVRPQIINGNKCLVVDQSLKQDNPNIYAHILAFVKANNLKIHEECDAGEK